MNYIDAVILFIVGFSTMLGFFRGFITEVMSLVVWCGALFVAIYFGSDIANILDFKIEEPFRSIFAFGITFLLALFCGGLINVFITFILRTFKIMLPDRFFGLIFGFLRGIIIIGIASLLIMKTPIADKDFMNQVKESVPKWASEGGFKAKLAPILMNVLTKESILSKYAIQCGQILETLAPNDFLSGKESENIP